MTKLKTESVANSSPENWMEGLQEYIQDLQLHEVMIPGTHDAGCYHSSSPLGQAWIKTQKFNISQQLKAGVRFFDLRFAYFKNHSKDEFWIAHGTWNTAVSLRIVTKAIKEFLDNHPKEIVIIKLSHFRNFTEAARNQFIQRWMNKQELGHYLVPRAQGPAVLFSQLWAQNKRLIVITDYDPNHPKLWPETYHSSKWCNTLDKTTLKTECEQELNKTHSVLWALELILTPSTSYVAKNYLTQKGLEELSQKTNPDIKQWLYADENWNNNVNLFMVDFFKSPDWANIAIKANKKRLLNKIAIIINQEGLSEDVKVKTASLFDRIKNSQFLQMPDAITQSQHRLQFYQFLYEVKLRKENNNFDIYLLYIRLKHFEQQNYPAEIKNECSEFLKHLEKNYKINENFLASGIFEEVYRPKLDYQYKACFLENDTHPIAKLASCAERRELAMQEIQMQCEVSAERAHELFTKARSVWLEAINLNDLIKDNTRQLSQKILKRIYELNNKVGAFGGEQIEFDGRHLKLPKCAKKMLESYSEYGDDQPEKFVEQCIEIANSAIKRGCGTLFNRRQDDTQDFVRWLSKIRVPEMQNCFQLHLALCNS